LKEKQKEKEKAHGSFSFFIGFSHQHKFSVLNCCKCTNVSAQKSNLGLCNGAGVERETKGEGEST
jgi:hypothetical protein